MKCPKCRREIAYAAIVCKCGWKATVSAHTTAAPKRELVKHCAPASPEIREKLQLLLKQMREAVRPKLERQLVAREEVTQGHGSHCFCELCFPKRMKSKRGNSGCDADGR